MSLRSHFHGFKAASHSVRFEEVLNLLLFKTCNPLKEPTAIVKKKKHPHSRTRSRFTLNDNVSVVTQPCRTKNSHTRQAPPFIRLIPEDEGRPTLSGPFCSSDWLPLQKTIKNNHLLILIIFFNHAFHLNNSTPVFNINYSTEFTHQILHVACAKEQGGGHGRGAEGQSPMKSSLM